MRKEDKLLVIYSKEDKKEARNFMKEIEGDENLKVK